MTMRLNYHKPECRIYSVQCSVVCASKVKVGFEVKLKEAYFKD